MTQLDKLGFHGDIYLLQIIDLLVEGGKVKYFIETGTNQGRTLTYFASKYKHVECFSCEASKKAFSIAVNTCKRLNNIVLKNSLSQDFFVWSKKHHSDIFKQPTLFWLDAHGCGFTWPLQTEIEFITNNFKHCYVIIDDFKVPDNLNFEYDEYKSQICSHKYIKNDIHWDNYELYYPAYTERTSTFHPLKGWGLYIYGMPDPLLHYPNLAYKI
jgi:hypothetical protein